MSALFDAAGHLSSDDPSAGAAFYVSLWRALSDPDTAKISFVTSETDVTLIIDRLAGSENVALPADAYNSVQALLLDRAFFWPDAGDDLFATNLRKKRLLFSPAGEKAVMATITGELQRGKKASFAIEEIVRDCGQPLLERLSLSETNKRFLSELTSVGHGLLIADTTASPFQIDARAIIAALRPDTVLYRETSGVGEVLSAAENGIALVMMKGSDPFEVTVELLSACRSVPALESRFVNSFAGSFVHRRVRRTCTNCARPTVVTPSITERVPHFLSAQIKDSYLFGRGCEKCGQTAYRGTVGLDSICRVGGPFRDLLRNRSSIRQLTDAAYRSGARSLTEDGLAKIFGGLTTFEEVLAAAPRPSAAFEAVITQYGTTAESNTSLDRKIDQSLQAVDPDFFSAEKKSEPVKQCILLIEDDPDQLSILELVFKASDYDVVTASGGKEALALLEQREVDAIVCDLMMPEMDGSQVVQRVRANPKLKHIPVLMLTAVDSADTEHDLLEKGADDYCAKNVKRKVLLKRVERLLERRSSAQPNPLRHLLDD